MALEKFQGVIAATTPSGCLTTALGGFDGFPRFVAAQPRHRADDTLIHRVGHVDRRGAAHPVSVNGAFVLEQRLVLEYVAQGLAFADIHDGLPVSSWRPLSTCRY